MPDRLKQDDFLTDLIFSGDGNLDTQVKDYFPYVSKIKQSDKDFVESLFARLYFPSFRWLSNIGDNLKDNEEFLLKIVSITNQKKPDKYRYDESSRDSDNFFVYAVSQRLQNNVSFIKKVLDICPDFYYALPAKMKSNPNLRPANLPED